MSNHRVEKQKKTMFTTRNIYWLVSEPQGWVVSRRNSDFKWLAERLKREYPHIKVVYVDCVGAYLRCQE